MMIRMTPILKNEDPVFLHTAHSIGKAWQSAIIRHRIVAWRNVSGMDIMAATPAYVPAVAPVMKMTAEDPGNPMYRKTGLRY